MYVRRERDTTVPDNETYPWLGLTDENGDELDTLRCRGYHRVNLGDVIWRVELKFNEVTKRDCITFVNMNRVIFPQAKNDWGNIQGVQMFDGPYSDDSRLCDPVDLKLPTNDVESKVIILEVGDLQFYFRDIDG